MDLLAGIQAFVQVAETRSFAAAARNLSLSPSAVSKLIGRTEESVGAKLFHRNTRSISLTAEGATFLRRCRSILDELDEAKQELATASESPKGKLQLSLPNLGNFFLPVISGFADAYPEITLQIEFTDRLVDVIEEGFDIVARTGKISDSRLTSRFISGYEMRLVGSPGYFSKNPAPATPCDLAGHHCIQYRFPSSGRTEVWPLSDFDPAEIKLHESIVCNSTEARMTLALMGQGIACLPDFLVKGYIERGELISVLQQDLNWKGTFHLLWPTNRHRSPKLRAFIDYFSEHAFLK